MTAKEARERLDKRIYELSEIHKKQYNDIIKSIQKSIDELQTYKTEITFYYYEMIDVSVLEQLKQDGYTIHIESSSHRNETTYTINVKF